MSEEQTGTEREMINEEDVRHVARLARLGLADEEVLMLQGQLDQVLGYVEKLQAVDTSEVEGTVHAGGSANVMRGDAPRAGLEPGEALLNAPEAEGSFFRVPPVIDDFAPDAGSAVKPGARNGS